MNVISGLWSILTRTQRRHVLVAQGVALLMAFSTVVGIAAIAPFFAVLGDAHRIDRSGFLHWLYQAGGFSSQRSFVVALGVTFVGVVVLANLINFAGAVAINRLVLSIGNDLQTTLFGEYLGRPYLFHTRTNSAQLFNNIIYETARVTNGILQNIFTLTTNFITAVFIVASILVVNPALAVAMLGVLAGGYALIYLVVRNRLLRWGRIQTRFTVEQAKIVNESFGAIRDIIVRQAQGLFRSDFERSSRSVAHAVARTHLVGQSPRLVMECAAVAGLVGVALVLDARGEGIGPSLGQLTFLGFAAYRLLPTLQQSFGALVRVRADTAGFALIGPDLRLARAARADGVTDAGDARDVRWRDLPRTDITLTDVSFRYAADRPFAVRGISLRIPARGSVGLVGSNGSGKTTVMNLIAGLLVPETGQVATDGIVIDATTRAAWQSRIAYVPQNVFLLDASVAQNIALGIPSAAIDRPRVLQSARLAQLDEFVATLPDGYDYRIGERGVGMSGGQRQRIGIARALYTDASVLLLDEATNELDGLTEEELVTTLARLRGRYTMVLIAHRLSTVRACDLIYEIDNGTVVSCGTYAELFECSATFRRMAGSH